MTYWTARFGTRSRRGSRDAGATPALRIGWPAASQTIPYTLPGCGRLAGLWFLFARLWDRAGRNDATEPTVATGIKALTVAAAGSLPLIAAVSVVVRTMTYKERSTLDGLEGNDGSWLFGPDARRQWYYRIAGAWRLGQDLNVRGLDEFKLRAAYGEPLQPYVDAARARGAPRFDAETWSRVGSAAALRPYGPQPDAPRAWAPPGGTRPPRPPPPGPRRSGT